MTDIDDILSFVEDVDVLKDKLKGFVDVIQKILETITACSSSIKDYLEANAASMCSNNVYSKALTVFQLDYQGR